MPIQVINLFNYSRLSLSGLDDNQKTWR